MPDNAQPRSRAPAVLQVLPTLRDDGQGRGALDLARAIAREGWRSHVASAGGSLERELVGSGVRHHRLPREGAGLIATWSNAARLTRIVREHDVDLIHAVARRTAWGTSLAARRTGAAFLTTAEAIHPEDGSWGGLRRHNDRVLAAGERVVAVSEHIADHLHRTCGVEPGRVRIVRPGIDMTAFDAERVRGHRVAALAERWHLGFERKIVMLPGPVAKAGGHHLMLRAMRRLARRDFTLLIVGDVERDPAYARRIEVQARQDGLTERVHFAGPCADLPAAYMLADLVVVPALQAEGYVRPAIEAQAMGKLVIVNNTGGLDETVKPVATGWLVRAEDPAELAWALDLALSFGDDDKARHARHARGFVAHEFSLEQMCRKTLAVYRELVRRHEPKVVEPLAAESG